jgi:hypothetical protein
MNRTRPTNMSMAVTTQELPREAWRSYFDELSKILGAVEATVEITGPDVGDQIEADHLILTGITYDDRDDIVVIGLDAPGPPPEDVERIVDDPQRILIATGTEPPEEMVIDIEDAEQHKTLVRIERPPALPGE